MGRYALEVEEMDGRTDSALAMSFDLVLPSNHCRKYSAARSLALSASLRSNIISPFVSMSSLFSASEESHSLGRLPHSSLAFIGHGEKQKEKRKEICAVDEMWMVSR